MTKRNCRGFNLIEIIAVIIIIGILTSIAIPNYIRSRERALGQEARANLKLIAAAEKIYRMETTTYYPASESESSIGTINTNLKLSLSSGSARNWDYSIDGGADTFTAYATRFGYGDCKYKIVGSQDETVVESGTCP